METPIGNEGRAAKGPPSLADDYCVSTWGSLSKLSWKASST